MPTTNRIMLPIIIEAGLAGVRAVGIAATRTAGESIDGVLDSDSGAYYVDIEISGLYKLEYNDGEGWNDYTNFGNKILLGGDFDNHILGHGHNLSGKIISADIENGAVTPTKTSFADDYV